MVCYLVNKTKEEAEKRRMQEPPSVEEAGESADYGSFYAQLIIGSLMPDLAINAYMLLYLRGWSQNKIRRAKSIRYGLISFSVLLLTTMGFTVYKSMALLESVPTNQLLSMWIIFAIYGYLGWWCILGACLLIVTFVWLVVELRNCFRRVHPVSAARQEEERQAMLERLRERERQLRAQSERGTGEPMTILKLNEGDFNHALFDGAGIECAICMDTFEPGQKVTALPCDIRHYFHTRCILSWSRTTRNCPLCKTIFTESDVLAFNKEFTEKL